MHRKIHQVLVTVALATSVTHLYAQTARVIPATASCETCVITLSPVATLADDGDKVALGQEPSARMIDDDRAVLWSRAIEGMYVWHVRTSSVQKVARKGDGPGEFRNIMNVQVLPSGDLYVGDYSQRRMTVLSNRLELKTSFPLQNVSGSSSSTVNAMGELIVAGEYAEDTTRKAALHLVSKTGELLNNFGVAGPTNGAKGSLALSRLIARAPGNSFWAVSPYEYRIERWDYAGKLLQTLSVQKSGVTAGTPNNFPTGRAAPTDLILAIASYGGDTLLVVIRTASKKWRPPALDTTDEAVGYHMTKQEERDSLYDVRVELVDTKAGRIIARLTSDQFHWSAGSKYLYHHRYSADGEMTLEMVRVSLVDSAKRGRGRGIFSSDPITKAPHQH